MRLPSDEPSLLPHVGQVQLNDLCRLLTGHTRKDRIRVSTLTDKAKVPTLNEIIVKRSALEAWKARNGGVLETALIPINSLTRASSNGLVKSRTESIPDTNMKKCWNSSQSLRDAKSLSEAKRVAKLLASEARHL